MLGRIPTKHITRNTRNRRLRSSLDLVIRVSTFEKIAYTPLRMYVFGFAGIGFDLLAKTPYMHIHGPLVTRILAAPHEREELFS